MGRSPSDEKRPEAGGGGGVMRTTMTNTFFSTSLFFDSLNRAVAMLSN